MLLASLGLGSDRGMTNFDSVQIQTDYFRLSEFVLSHLHVLIIMHPWRARFLLEWKASELLHTVIEADQSGVLRIPLLLLLLSITNLRNVLILEKRRALPYHYLLRQIRVVNIDGLPVDAWICTFILRRYRFAVELGLDRMLFRLILIQSRCFADLRHLETLQTLLLRSEGRFDRWNWTHLILLVVRPIRAHYRIEVRILAHHTVATLMTWLNWDKLLGFPGCFLGDLHFLRDSGHVRLIWASRVGIIIGHLLLLVHAVIWTVYKLLLEHRDRL